jgi:tRNA(fMet)-specific endonuclease VapC
MTVFDTDVISYVMRANPPAGLLRRIAGVPAAAHATTAITFGELVYGARRSARPDHYLARLRELLWPNLVILPFDAAAAERYGEVRATLAGQGTIVAEPDLRIAAICLVHGARLATGNMRQFARIPGLEAQDWLADYR